MKENALAARHRALVQASFGVGGAGIGQLFETRLEPNEGIKAGEGE